MTVDPEADSRNMNEGSAPTGEFEIVPLKQLDDFAWAREIGGRGVWGRGGLPQIFNHPLPFDPNLWILYRREWNITNAVDFRRPWM